MDEGLKNKAYLEGSRLKNAGYDDEVIFCSSGKTGYPGGINKKGDRQSTNITAYRCS